MTTTPLIEVSNLASQKLEEILKEQGETDVLLRMMVVPGPHGSFQYMLGMEREAKADDLVVDAPGVQVLVDPESAPLVEGAQIDYVDGLMRSGFVISNPNFQVGGAGGCACGGGGCGCSGGGGGCGSGGGGGCGCGGH